MLVVQIMASREGVSQKALGIINDLSQLIERIWALGSKVENKLAREIRD